MSEKTKVIATTVIHRTLEPGKAGNRAQGIPAVKPKVQVIKSGTVFQTKDKAEYDELLASGAIRLPEKGEKVEVAIENIVEEETSKNGNGGPQASGGNSPRGTSGQETAAQKKAREKAEADAKAKAAADGEGGDGNDLV